MVDLDSGAAIIEKVIGDARRNRQGAGQRQDIDACHGYGQGDGLGQEVSRLAACSRGVVNRHLKPPGPHPGEVDGHGVGDAVLRADETVPVQDIGVVGAAAARRIPEG